MTARKSPPWLEHIHLIWLMGMLWAPFFTQGYGWLNWLVTLSSIGIFLAFYVLAHTRPHPAASRLRFIGIMVLMSFAVAPFNSWSSCYIIYAAGSAGYLQPARLAYRVVWLLAGCMAIYGVILAVAGAPLFIAVGLMAVLATFSVGVGLSNIQEAEQRRFNRQLEAARAENERLAAIAERERIARDLHDLLGHTLSVITLKAELATKLAERDPARARAEMLEVERISREATQQVREAVQGYKSRGLQGELASAKLAFESAGIQFDYYAVPLELSPVQESVLSLSLREAVTNVLRHSSATRCAVRLLRGEEGVRLEVEDNGRGGEVKAGSGLTGMRQRVEALGGSLEVGGANGFRLSILLPVGASSPPIPLTELKTQTSS